VIWSLGRPMSDSSSSESVSVVLEEVERCCSIPLIPSFPCRTEGISRDISKAVTIGCAVSM